MTGQLEWTQDSGLMLPGDNSNGAQYFVVPTYVSAELGGDHLYLYYRAENNAWSPDMQVAALELHP